MAFLNKVTLAKDGEVRAFMKIKFTEGKLDEFRIQVKRAETEELAGEAVWHVSETAGQFSLQITGQTIARGVFLAGCFADVVTGPFADCLGSARNRTEVRKCSPSMDIGRL